MSLQRINPRKWEKTTPFGDYEITHDRLSSRTNRQVHIIREAKALGIIGKHAGSKPLYKLLKSIVRARKAMHPTKVMSKEEEITQAKEMKEGDMEV